MNDQMFIQVLIGGVMSVISGFILLYIKNNMTREYKVTEEKLDNINVSLKKLSEDYSTLKLELVEKVGGTTSQIALINLQVQMHDRRITDLENIIDKRGK